MAISVKALHSLEEMYAAVELQMIYWGSEIESLVPAHMLFSIVNSGGHVLVAFDDDRMIGVLIGLIAAEWGEKPAREGLYIASKRMVVLPEYRSKGVGYQLKLAQRDMAIQQGIDLVSWTFDPLLATNAYFNLHKLGCVSRTYLENYYGTRGDTTGLTIMGVSDRLKVEWWVNNPQVESRLQGQFTPIDVLPMLRERVVNPVEIIRHLILPGEEITQVESEYCLIEIPVNYMAVVESDPPIGEIWREQTREAFLTMLSSGYTVRDFCRLDVEGLNRAFYLLQKSGE